MPAGAQAKLLRALQERRVRPVGTAEEVPVDVRIIAATNRDIDRSVEEEGFRGDLYYRVSVISFRLPPLRERAEDIPALVVHFIERINARGRWTRWCGTGGGGTCASWKTRSSDARW